ncbi:hypothetical protein ACSQ67_021904 [Phaseolus vulgaris]
MPFSNFLSSLFVYPNSGICWCACRPEKSTSDGFRRDGVTFFGFCIYTQSILIIVIILANIKCFSFCNVH